MRNHFLTDPWAPHPVVNSRNICFGGGGDDGPPDPPDYSEFIAESTRRANQLFDRSERQDKWAEDAGKALDTTAGIVSNRAGTAADHAMGVNQRLESKWEDTYGPLYDAQAADAKRMNQNLPQTEEDYAGKQMADVTQTFDAARASQERTLQGYGLKTPSYGRLQGDMTAGNQRAAAAASAAATGRIAARTEARNATTNSLQSGLALPQTGAAQAGVGLAAGNQQINAPESAISTTAGAYSPSIANASAATPLLKNWYEAMSNGYNQKLAAYNAEQNSGGGTGAILGTIGGIAGTAAGAYFGGPAGASIGGKLGSSAGSAIGSAARGGMIRRYADGGGVSDDGMEDGMGGGMDDANYVDPSMSPSNGAITDDVPAQLQAGEFVLPKRFVDFKGAEWIHKEIAKADKAEAALLAQTKAEPEMGPAPEQQANAGGAISTMPPMPRFVSEGARS